MQHTVANATLLKRSDASLYRVFLGVDCTSFVQRLTHEHCFKVFAILHTPIIAPDAREQLDATIHDLATHRGNAWFEASLHQAVTVFLSVLPTDIAGPSPLAEAVTAPCWSGISAHEHVQPTTCALAESQNAMCENREHAFAVSIADGSNEGVDKETDKADPLWHYVQACSTREATKCIEIRTALEAKVGKAETQKLLARTKPTVAQDTSGKKNRVLRLGGCLLKLK